MKRIAAFIGAFLGQLRARLRPNKDHEIWPPFSNTCEEARIARLRLAQKYFGVYGAVARRLRLGKDGRTAVCHVAHRRMPSPKIQQALLAEISALELRITRPERDELLPRLRALKGRTGKTAKRIAIEAGVSRWAIQRVLRGVYSPGPSVRERIEKWLTAQQGASA